LLVGGYGGRFRGWIRYLERGWIRYLDRIGGLFFLRGQIWAVDITMGWWAASSSTLAHDACWTKLLDSKASRNKVLHLVPRIFQK
jgi:hypothetical protein